MSVTKTLLDPEPSDCRYPVGSLKTVEELEPFDCRYPVGIETSECGFRVQLFCAEPCSEGRPYCQPHLAVCYRPLSAKQSREDRKLARETLKAALKNSKEKADSST
jgi:hypothetical protein